MHQQKGGEIEEYDPFGGQEMSDLAKIQFLAQSSYRVADLALDDILLEAVEKAHLRSILKYGDSYALNSSVDVSGLATGWAGRAYDRNLERLDQDDETAEPVSHSSPYLTHQSQAPPGLDKLAGAGVKNEDAFDLSNFVTIDPKKGHFISNVEVQHLSLSIPLPGAGKDGPGAGKGPFADSGVGKSYAQRVSPTSLEGSYATYKADQSSLADRDPEQVPIEPSQTQQNWRLYQSKAHDIYT